MTPSNLTPSNTLNRANAKRAIALLRRTAAPEHRHLWLGLSWLVVAAGLEALGPFLGKLFIDRNLVPRVLDWPQIFALLGG